MHPIINFLKALRKPFVAILVALLSFHSLSAQNTDVRAQKQQEILTLFDQKKYYQVLTELDWFFNNYPETEIWVRMMRVETFQFLNDITHVKNELIQLSANYPDFVSQYPELKFYTDKKYLVGKAAEGYVTDPVFDPERDFRLKLTACDTVRGALNAERSCYDVGFYDLNLTVDPENKQIAGVNKIYFTATESSDVIQVDLHDNYTIHSIKMDGKELSYSRNCQAILISLTENLIKGEKYCLEINYAGTPIVAVRPPWNGGFVWEMNKKRHWVGVACEHLGASSWWPVKDHLSDKPDSVTITINAPESYQAVANGNLRSIKVNPDKTTSFEWFVSYPINTYNVTCYVGDFVNFNEKNQNGSEPYQVDFYVLKNHLKKARKYYAGTGLILDTFGELFGTYPFPRDGAGYVEAPFEGMEHQGAIAIGDAYDKKSLSGVESDYSLLLVHETAHEWWGNAVAVGDMADAWINEGFATYSEFLFLEKTMGYQKYLEIFGTYSSNIVNAWPLVGDRDVNDNTFITNDIYFKGAAMLNNLRCIINNDSVFFSIIKGFYEEYRMKIACTQDFIDYVGKIYPSDLTEFFRVFLYKTDPPVLSYSFVLFQGTLIFNYAWTGVGKDFTMPFSIIVNNSTCIRLNGTTEMQTYKYNGANAFYLPNPFNFNPKVIEPNCFTYFQTYLIRG